MSTYHKATEVTDMFEIGENGFQVAKVKARSASATQIVSILGMGFLAVLIAGILTLQPANSSSTATVDAVTESQGLAATKTDRVKAPLPTTCEGQAWGAWSADCAAAITGAGTVRKIGFVTVEEPSRSVNETILARFPKAN